MASVAGGRITAGVGANLIGQHAQDRNQDATVYVGNLDVQLSEELVWELFVQSGPVVNVYLPKDRVTSQHQGYGFVEFKSEDDADYAIKILNMIKVYGKPIRVNKASQDKKTQDVGANLFIGNIDPDVDEKLLYDTFSAFGMIIQTPKIMRDPETGATKGFGFVSYDSFEASDAAIEAMNGQFLCNRPITVSFAYKKDTKGERHGSEAERQLATQQRTKAAAASRPHTLFASGPRQRPDGGLAPSDDNVPGPPPPPPAPGAPGMMYPGGPPMPMQMPGSGPPQWAPPQQQYGGPPRPPPWAGQPGGPPPPWGQPGPPMGMPPPPMGYAPGRPPPPPGYGMPPPGWQPHMPPPAPQAPPQ
ncbi:RNA-binding domain-containing protein [Coccomyxa subellipsoidea C-169]|uniref:Splicing factor 3B subunit 4 n=1 Tax=Coccomyxa subellipsoidea (strain C-169) TaxID=574566 RepID=I0YZV9_COCSC|nr:RNA-binding domain-containing protein [Coccomyxa subellipsoidea C-169]EIE23928.1 RNA-binding domain-containing protein [Coccomyxa subellipsoidea C-169]|eukprot:XP_005648472.1 RNA-binding domain-containing protein [Coccomyxa subellipsoidea C-169]